MKATISPVAVAKYQVQGSKTRNNPDGLHLRYRVTFNDKVLEENIVGESMANFYAKGVRDGLKLAPRREQ